MTEVQRVEIKKALIKCAEENEGKNTFTGYVIVSSVCKAGAERIAELEKENAELKEINTYTLSQLNLDNGELIIELTKAKDHIKKLLDCLKQDTNDPQTNYYVCQYMDKAEQFLKE